MPTAVITSMMTPKMEAAMDQYVKLGEAAKSQGVGMGLSIFRFIIEAHEGDISVPPGVGGGTAFRIALPIGEAAS